MPSGSVVRHLPTSRNLQRKPEKGIGVNIARNRTGVNTGHPTFGDNFKASWTGRARRLPTQENGDCSAFLSIRDVKRLHLLDHSYPKTTSSIASMVLSCPRAAIVSCNLTQLFADGVEYTEMKEIDFPEFRIKCSAIIEQCGRRANRLEVTRFGEALVEVITPVSGDRTNRARRLRKNSPRTLKGFLPRRCKGRINFSGLTSRLNCHALPTHRPQIFEHSPYTFLTVTFFTTTSLFGSSCGLRGTSEIFLTIS